MAGDTTNHNKIALNLSAGLNFAFRQQDYEVFMTDVRLWIAKKRIYTYPDVMVVAGEAEYLNNRTDIIVNPQVIVEVLSKSTQGCVDAERLVVRHRSGKFEIYRTIDTFQEYLLIDQTKIRVEQYSKKSKKQWSLYEYDEEDRAITLTSVPFEISLQDLYNKVKFEVVEPEDNSAGA